MKRVRDWMRGSGFGNGASAAALALAMTAPAYAQEQKVSFDIVAQPLSSALLELGRQARVSIGVPTELVGGRTAPAVQGELSLRQALDRLLSDTGLRYEFVQADAVRIFRDDHANLDPLSSERTDPAAAPRDLVVVTGTNLRGVAPDSSPVQIYSADDIASSGATTTEQFIQKLPQNLAKTSQYASGVTAARNYDSVSSVDLRGLGVGTTLTLLNGHRLALSNLGQSADVSMIPVAAISRVEVLTDGASAIYGSDAIGGVVNFVMRKDFTGAETRIGLGGVTSGGMRQGDFSQTLGTSWGSGGGLVSYTLHTASALARDDRDYAAPAGPGSLTPMDQRHNLFATMSQDVSDQLSISLDLGAATRKVKNTLTALQPTLPSVSSFSSYGSRTDQFLANLGINYRIAENLDAEFNVNYAQIDIDGDLRVNFFNRNPVQTNRGDFSTRDTIVDVFAKLDGALFALPGGDVRFSIGGGISDEDYAGYSPFSGKQGTGLLGRKSPYAFAELFAPLIGPDQAIPLVNRLEVSLAARYTDYQDDSTPALDRDFGDSIDPKIGLLWSPAPVLKLRATYGTSFRAPFLTQLDPSNGLHSVNLTQIAGQPGIYLSVNGTAVPGIGPETARSYTFGFDYESEGLPGFRISGSYYNVDYQDRIGSAPNGGISPFPAPELLPDIIYRPTSAAQVEALLGTGRLSSNGSGIDLSDPAAAAAILFARPNFWIHDTRYKNLAVSETDGFDISISQSLDLPIGSLRLGADVTHILSYKQQGSPNSAIFNAVDVPGQPADWRGRAFATLSSGDLNTSLNVNYTDSYVNPSNAAAPETVDSWTTADFSLAWSFAAFRNEKNAQLSLGVQNLFDEAPPELRPGIRSGLIIPIGFDPANANPLGRFVTLGLTYKW